MISGFRLRMAAVAAAAVGATTGATVAMFGVRSHSPSPSRTSSTRSRRQSQYSCNII